MDLEYDQMLLIPNVDYSWQDAKQVLARLFGTISDCVLSGQAELREIPPELYKDMSPLALSITRNNFIAANAKRQFEGMADVNLFDAYHTLVIKIGDDCALHFKKLDDNLMPRYGKTRRQIYLKHQGRSTMLPSVPRVVVGYRLNKLRTGIDKVVLQYWRGEKRYWSHVIWSSDEPDGRSKTLVPTPTKFTPNDNGQRRVRPNKPIVTPRTSDDAG